MACPQAICQDSVEQGSRDTRPSPAISTGGLWVVPRSFGFEIAGGNEHEFARINSLAQDRADLVRCQSLDLLFQISVIGHGATQVAQVGQQSGDGDVARPRYFLRLKITLPR